MAFEGISGLRRRFARVGAVATMVAMVGFAGPVTQAAAATVPINLLTINDFHGQINATTLRFAATVETLRAAAGADNTLLIGAGDFVGAAAFASRNLDDQPTIDVMNELGVDVSAVGNHEFDKGSADLFDRIIQQNGVPNALWPYLGANVYNKGTLDPAMLEYKTFDVSGITVGVIGAVTKELGDGSLVSPAGIATLDIGDPVEAINRVAAQLSDGDDANGEAQVLVATIHDGAPTGTPRGGTLESNIAESSVFAQIVNDTSAQVDAIITAHTHEVYAWDAPVPGQDGRTRPIIETGNYGTNVGQIQLSVDSDTGEVTAYTVANVPRIEGETDADDAALDAQLLADFPDSLPAIQAIVEDALAKAAVIGNEPVGSVSADITTAYGGGSYVDGFYTGGTRDDRASESTLGNLVANSLVAVLGAPEYGAAEIGVVNPGGLRSELLFAPDGVVTFGEADSVLPFVNNLVTVSLTGAQFKDLLEQQWQLSPNGTVPSRPYLQLGLSDNVTYTFDPGAAQGEHILSVTVDGVPVDPTASYRIGTSTFLLEGGDNFRALTGGTDATEVPLIDSEAWVQFLRANPGIEPDFARHSVAVTGGKSLPGAGGTGTLQISKLDLTSLGAPANTSLAVQLVAPGADADADPIVTELGSFPVVDGAATVTFTVPPVGIYLLAMRAAPSDTTVTLPLTVLATEPTASSSTPPSTPSSTATTAKPTKGPQLSSTGISSSASTGTALTGAALVLLGGLLLLLVRTRAVSAHRSER